MVTREKQLRARISDAEEMLIRHLARIERVGISEAVRLALREEGKRRGLWPPREGDGPRVEGERGE